MFHKRLYNRWIVLTFIIVALCIGCSGPKKKDSVDASYSDEEEIEEELDVQLKPSLHQVKLSWNQIEGATRYVITREEHKSKGIDYNEIGKLIKEDSIAELSPEETSFRDNDVKAGNYYIYDIYAYRDTDAPTDSGNDTGQKDSSDTVATVKTDATTSEGADPSSVLHTQETILLMIGYANWDSAALHLDGFSAVTSPTDITLNAAFMSNNYYDIEPMGMEIYRGTSPLTMEKLADIPFAEDEFWEKEGVFRYTDKTVEAGKTYYYQVAGYIDYEGKREYGESSSYLKRTAVLPVGEYSMDFTQQKNGFEISLQSSNEDNAELEFITNQFNGLVDYIYQKSDYSYGSTSMCLEAYKPESGKWKSYQGETLCLKGGEKIALRFVPIEGEEKPALSKDSQNSAEILLMTKYNGEYVNMHFDFRQNRTFLTDLGSETDMEWAYWDTTEKTISADDVHTRADKQNNAVPDVYIYGGFHFGSIYGDSLSCQPDYSKKSMGNCPDGVEIYRSTDNKNFSKVADIKYFFPDNEGYAEPVEYDDPDVIPGKSYYYKARNYIDTADGRIYGKMSEYWDPFYAYYNAGIRYKMWQAGGKTATGREPIVIGLYSCSLGNPPLEITPPRYGSIQKSDEQTIYGFTETEYSTDGVHWKKITKKIKQLKLLPKETLYLKIKPDDIDWEDVDTFSLEAEQPEDTYVAWEGDGGGMELSCKINSGERLQQTEEN